MEKGRNTTTELEPQLTDPIHQLVVENEEWARGVARSVARAWNMDSDGDGLTSAALEALMFCAKRFEAARGVPFRGYARKRIHEASTEEARKSKNWQRGIGASTRNQKARELSSELFNAFPELRDGHLPGEESGGDEDMRGAIRNVLVGASILAAKQEFEESSPDTALDVKRTISFLCALEPVHQALIWKVYWEGLSLRSLATEWETDDLNVTREHKILLAFLNRSIETGKRATVPKIRPALRRIALACKRDSPHGPFSELLERGQS